MIAAIIKSKISNGKNKSYLHSVLYGGKHTFVSCHSLLSPVVQRCQHTAWHSASILRGTKSLLSANWVRGGQKESRTVYPKQPDCMKQRRVTTHSHQSRLHCMPAGTNDSSFPQEEVCIYGNTVDTLSGGMWVKGLLVPRRTSTRMGYVTVSVVSMSGSKIISEVGLWESLQELSWLCYMRWGDLSTVKCCHSLARILDCTRGERKLSSSMIGAFLLLDSDPRAICLNNEPEWTLSLTCCFRQDIFALFCFR